MRAILATVRHEWLLLSRDRGGLGVLFVMPLALVLLISLVMDNVMDTVTDTDTVFPICVVDEDGGAVAAALVGKVDAQPAFAVVDERDGLAWTAAAVRRAVADGEFLFGLRIPAGTTAAVDERIRAAAAAALDPAAEPETTPEVVLDLWFDPLVQGDMRSSVDNALKRLLMAVEMDRQAELMGEELPAALDAAMAARLRPFGFTPHMLDQLESFTFEWDQRLSCSLVAADPLPGLSLPTSAQQNVPAWTLFGMFFIVVPLAGSLIRERRQGTLARLMVMSFPPGSLLLAKTLAYLAVCVVQCVLMLLVGVFALPRFGPAALELGPTPWLLLPVALCAALAATAYGVAVGCWFRSNDQASMFGAISVVVAAALGGTMIPTFVMPAVMQKVAMVSPLGWAHQAFLDVFLRGVGPADLARPCGLLLAFSLACLLVARFGLRKPAG